MTNRVRCTFLGLLALRFTASISGMTTPPKHAAASALILPRKPGLTDKTLRWISSTPIFIVLPSLHATILARSSEPLADCNAITHPRVALPPSRSATNATFTCADRLLFRKKDNVEFAAGKARMQRNATAADMFAAQCLLTALLQRKLGEQATRPKLEKRDMGCCKPWKAIRAGGNACARGGAVFGSGRSQARLRLACGVLLSISASVVHRLQQVRRVPLTCATAGRRESLEISPMQKL